MIYGSWSCPVPGPYQPQGSSRGDQVTPQLLFMPPSSICSHRPGVIAKDTVPSLSQVVPHPNICCSWKCPALAQGSAAIPEQSQALKARLANTSSTLQGCPSPGTLERASAQALESLESRKHQEQQQKPSSEPNITTSREDLPSPELT